MSILDFIERLREKSVTERKQWAFAVALGITLFVGLIWASFLAVRLSNFPTQEVQKEESTPVVVVTDTPFGTLSAGLSEAWVSLKESIKSLGSINYEPGASSSTENGLR